MDGELDAATGTLTALAVEREAGHRPAQAGRPHGLCLNCGTALLGDFCHACGQTTHLHRTVLALPRSTNASNRRRSPELFVYKLQSSAHKYRGADPISLPFIWLLFAFRRDVGPYDHAIFATFSLSAMLLGVSALSVGGALGLPEGVIVPVLVFGPPFHMYRQLKGAYQLGRLAALWRTVALVFSAYVSAAVFFLLLVGISD